jgi:cell division protein FtsI (penicillin-binding protein 3)
MDMKRLKLVGVGFAVLFGVIFMRAIMIHLFPNSSETLETIAKNQYQKPLRLAASRGNIFDHRKVPLAISVQSPSFAINPKVFKPSTREIQKLARILDLKPQKIKSLMAQDRYFAWLKRKVHHSAAQSVRNLDLPGLFQIMEPNRFYPGGNIGANFIGYVGIDNQGLLGIEDRYNQHLTGLNTEAVLSRDARGQPIFRNPQKATPEAPGHNLVLTIDRVIQEISEESLQTWIKKSGAKSGFAIVADPHTGRVLAMANYPSFDPNFRQSNLARTKNFAVADSFEPGSVVKPMVIAQAIETGKTTADEVHNCEKSGVLRIGPKNRIRDDHPKEYLSTAEVIVHSSNICTFKIAQRLGPEELYKTYLSYGFGDSNFSMNLPGETRGRISDWQKWRPIRFANISFGQGHLVNGMEMVRAYSVLANGGNLISPYILDRIESSDGKIISSPHPFSRKKIISPETAKIMREILRQTVENGTATQAISEHFTTAGKTGTSEKVDPLTKAYSDDKRIASFAGFSPTKDPHIVVYVVIDEPKQKPYYGGVWAAPVFREIVDKTLRYLNVPPDKISSISISSDHESSKPVGKQQTRL